MPEEERESLRDQLRRNPDRTNWGPPTPPPPPPPAPPVPPYPYPYAPVPQKRRVGHVVALVVGGFLFVLGAGLYVWVNQAYSLCQSGVGEFGQALSQTIAFRCGIVSMIHSTSVILLVVGGITAVIGALIRVGRSSGNG